MKQPARTTRKALKQCAKIILPIICLLSPLFLQIDVFIGNGHKKDSRGYATERISYSEYLTRVEKSKRQKYPVPDFISAYLEMDSNRILRLDSPIGAKAAYYLIWMLFATGPILIIMLFLLPYKRSRPKSKVKGKDSQNYYSNLDKEQEGFFEKYNIQPDDNLGLEAGEFSLSSGRKVQVKRIYIMKTYEGFLEGRINKNYNSRLFQSLTYPKDWGDIKAFKIPPSDEDFNSFLKGSFISVWLTSHIPIKKKNSGSQLIISWCDDFPLEEPLVSFFQNTLEDLHWTEIAEDFDY